jgi:lysophospholipase L1-like esterase
MVDKITLKSGMRVLFTGDSITDCGRGFVHRLGTGYVRFIAQSLQGKYPKLNISIENTGIGGNTTRDLLRRWVVDCIDVRADVVSILIGVNDLWRGHAEPECLPMAVFPEEFEANYRLMLDRVRDELDCQLILVEPFMFCNNTDNAMFAELTPYRDAVARLAKEYGAAGLGLQEMIDTEIVGTDVGQWSEDCVHPSEWAHRWIAEKWLGKVAIEQ